MNVIFLDIDGVLVTPTSIAACHTRGTGHMTIQEFQAGQIDPHKVMIMKAICSITDAKVVLSSTWRKFKDHVDAIKDVWPDCPFHDDWRTPDLDRMNGPVWTSPGRGFEIATWLSANPSTHSFIVIDDETSDILNYIDPARVLKTDFEKGILPHHIPEAEKRMAKAGRAWFSLTPVEETA